MCLREERRKQLPFKTTKSVRESLPMSFCFLTFFLFDLRGSKERESNQEKQTRKEKEMRAGCGQPSWKAQHWGTRGNCSCHCSSPAARDWAPARKPHPLGPSAAWNLCPRTCPTTT